MARSFIPRLPKLPETSAIGTAGRRAGMVKKPTGIGKPAMSASNQYHPALGFKTPKTSSPFGR